MKKKVVIGLIFSVILLITHASVALAGGTTSDGGNGGNFCKKGNAPAQPCDLYFQNNDFELPYTELQKVPFEKLPRAMLEELDKIEKFIKLRSLKQLHMVLTEGKLANNAIHVYNTKEFLGEDVFLYSSRIEKRQVGFAYSAHIPKGKATPDNDVINVIELDLDYLKTSSPRNQAFAYLHEYLHLVRKKHEFISPFIKALGVLLTIQDEQKKGQIRELTKEELQTSRNFQIYLTQLGFEQECLGVTQIHQNGGGLVIFHKLNEEIYHGKFKKDAENPLLANSFKTCRPYFDSETPNKKALEIFLSKTNFISIDSVVYGKINEGHGYVVQNEHVSSSTVNVKSFASFKKSVPVEFIPQEEVEIFVGGQTVFSDQTYKNVSVAGGFSTLDRCLEFDKNGNCIKDFHVLPIEFELAVGEKNRLNKFTVSLVKWGFGNKTATEYKCFLNAGTFTYEQLQQNLGSAWSASLGKAECEDAWNIIENGNLKFLFQAGVEGAPAAIMGIGDVSLNQYTSATNTFTFRAELSAGIEILKKLKIIGFADGDLYFGGSERPGNAHEFLLAKSKLGIKLHLKLPKGFYLQGSYQKNLDFIHPEMGADLNFSEDVFGIGIGVHH